MPGMWCAMRSAPCWWSGTERCSVIARSEATKQSRLPPRSDSGLLRCARNDDLERLHVSRTIPLALHPGYETTTPCVARRAKHPSGGSTRVEENIPLYRNSETAYASPHSGPRKRGVSRSSRHAGRIAVDVGHIGARGIAGRATVSDARRAHDRCDRRTAKSCGPGARSLCAKCCGDACARPGARISHPQGDGGNSASLPGEITT
ncbi:hypothetical protein ABIB73_006301 [Bradyrhizobium sp. F1.4.3]